MFIELVIVPDDINCAAIDIGGNREAKNDYGNERAKTFVRRDRVTEVRAINT